MKFLKTIKKLFKGVSPYNLLFLTAAGIINAVGVTIFLAPASLYDGGFSGLSFFLSQYSPLHLSIWLVILNVPFYIIGFKRLKFPFIVYSLWAIGMYSLWAFLFQSVFNIDFTGGSPLAGNDLLLCALCGGLVSGIGSGTTIRFGGAIDGVEVTAVLFARRLNISIGTFVMLFNATVYIIAGIVGSSWQLPLYSVIAYAIGLKAVDFVIDGFDKAKSAFIITTMPNSVAEALSAEFGRGITIIDAHGYYSNEDKAIVYCVINRFEEARLKKTITEVDSSAFVAINDVTDFIGRGLRFGRSAKMAEKRVRDKAEK